MNKDLDVVLVKCLVDLLASIELSDEQYIDEDFAVDLMSNTSADLSELSADGKERFIGLLHSLRNEFEGERLEFVNEFPQNFNMMP